MKITVSAGYYDDPCQTRCQRAYCAAHRLLWRYCETAQRSWDDTGFNGKPNWLWFWGDCPSCERENKDHKVELLRRRHAA